MIQKQTETIIQGTMGGAQTRPHGTQRASVGYGSGNVHADIVCGRDLARDGDSEGCNAFVKVCSVESRNGSLEQQRHFRVVAAKTPVYATAIQR
jgi:hypothetical protein